jgi:hypothetical protein
MGSIDLQLQTKDVFTKFKFQALCDCISIPCDAMPGRDFWESKRPKTDFETRIIVMVKSRNSSVGIALGYGLDDRGSRVRFPVGAGNFSLPHRVQTGAGAHLTSYPMRTRGSFPEGKAAGAWSWPLTFI